ncbi:putative PHD type zinc finger protein with BAH domain-containing protein [Paramarasmius palmivorus]|uniref:PHD type zinc finger protein with BAH domain-containing protein n=1 Tax=Paramarasmius palmivorus TaxID=297713 RepID=A0AAW0DVL5_9AGAR
MATSSADPQASSSTPSSIAPPPEKFPVYLKNGQQIRVNDHVYCSPPWSIRDGTPYSIARIMEFLRPENISSEEYHYTRVRLAWYYRPSDVSDRPVSDSRLLLAAIYSEICDINQIRGKCHVVHRDKISDLAGWKKRPDRFYFTRLFDPYIKKEFEVIKVGDVRNGACRVSSLRECGDANGKIVPENVRQTLMERYEYIVAEKEVIPDLTDAVRLCETCTEWCPTPESVQCDRCKRYFHMKCVQPPLLAKPSRGYGWTCAPCSRRHEEMLDSRRPTNNNSNTANNNNAASTSASASTPTTSSAPRPPLKSNAPAPRGRGRPRKDKSLAEKEENMPIRHFKMWPFRYFGQFTVAEDTLDPEDLIFPRAATRVGQKYQPVYPEFGSAHLGIDEERGEDKTIEVLSALHDFTSAEIAEVEKHLSVIANEKSKDGTPKATLYSVDFLTEAIRQISDASMNGRPLTSVCMKTIEASRMEKWKTHPTKFYTDPEWTEHEKDTFEEAIGMYGAELRAVRDEIVVKSMPEVVRYYGHWKNQKLGEEHRRPPPPQPIYARYASSSSPSQTIGPSSDSDVESPPTTKPPSCGACRTRESKSWWKAPKGLQSNLLCETCGTNWRKYADLNVRPVREESLPAKSRTGAGGGSGERGGEKREGTPLSGPVAKKVKVTPTPPPPTNVPQIKCCACTKNGPLGKVLKCIKCGFQCHAASCGATIAPAMVDKWQCDLCRNEEAQEASIYHDCLLCPRKRTPPPADSFLRACKPTEGQGWAHVLCSVFIPELVYTDSGHLKSVEGVSTIPDSRWSSPCAICSDKGGAVVKCWHCPKEFHVSCAWNAGYKFGFDVQPADYSTNGKVKSSRRDTTVTTTFQGDSGLMTPVIMCKNHDLGKRRLYHICETDEGGESVVQVYARAYKQASTAQTHGLLRKARRLDHILNVQQQLESDASVDNLECVQCKTQFTPAFYPVEDGTGGWLCHCCHFKAQPPPPQPMTVSPPLTPVEETMPAVSEAVVAGVSSNGVLGST